MITTLSKLGVQRIFLNFIKNIHGRPTRIILKCEKFRTFSLISGTRQRCPLSSLLFNITPEVNVNAVKQEKKIKNIQTWKKEMKLSANYMTVHVEILKDLAKNNNSSSSRGEKKISFGTK